MATVFFSHKDEELRDRLETHLATLKRQGQIDTWHDRRILGGDDFAGRISEQLEQADIILLLVSPEFLASSYCYDREMIRAMERHQAGQARVIPIILRHCDWRNTPFGKLQAAPRDGRPVRSWPDCDEALLSVVLTIRATLGASNKSKQAIPPKRPATPTTQSEVINQPDDETSGMRNAIIVAVVALVGPLGAAVIGNWQNLKGLIGRECDLNGYWRCAGAKPSDC